MDRLRRLPSGTVDVALGSVFVVLGLLSTAPSRGGDPVVVFERRDALAYGLILAVTTPYFVRRRAPLPVFLVSVSALMVLALLEYNEGVLPLVVLVGAYTVGAHGSTRGTIVAGAYVGIVLATLYVGDAPGFAAGEFLSNAAIFGSAILVGRNVQARRLRLEALERGQEAAAAKAATDERLRIAQEVHDVVAHSLGVIAVQAGVGLHVLESDPAETRRALEHISTTSRSSLAEIRGLLGAIRGTDAGYTPAPDLRALPRLQQDVERAGLRVTADVGDDLDTLPAGVQLAAYRIVQEALTNALRHAGAARATVSVDVVDDELRIEVADDGRGSSASAGAPAGHGLVGMRERVALYGGTLRTGNRPEGGFRVSATLPLHTQAVP